MRNHSRTTGANDDGFRRIELITGGMAAEALLAHVLGPSTPTSAPCWSRAEGGPDDLRPQSLAWRPPLLSRRAAGKALGSRAKGGERHGAATLGTGVRSDREHAGL